MENKNAAIVLTTLFGCKVLYSGVEWVCNNLATRHIEKNCLVGTISHKISISAQKNDPETWDELGNRIETYPTFDDIPAYCEITQNNEGDQVSLEEQVVMETKEGFTPIQLSQHLNVRLNDCTRTRCIVNSTESAQKRTLHCPTQLNINIPKGQHMILEAYEDTTATEFNVTHVSNYPVARYKQILVDHWTKRAFTGILTATVLGSLGYFVSKKF